MLCNSKIVPEMYLLIDLLAVVNVVALVCKGCFSLRMRLPSKRLRPEESVRSLQAQLGKSFVISVSHFTIDLDESRNRVTSSVWIELTQHLLHKLISDLNLVVCVDWLLLFGKDNSERGGNVFA